MLFERETQVRDWASEGNDETGFSPLVDGVFRFLDLPRMRWSPTRKNLSADSRERV